MVLWLVALLLGLSPPVWADTAVLLEQTDGTTTRLGGAGSNLRSGTATAGAPTLVEGSAGSFSFDLAGNARVTLGTLLSGEDQTNNVLRVEGQFLSSSLKTADFQVKASAGFLHCIFIAPNDAAPTAGQIDIYDNTAESGTKIFHYEVVVATMFAPIRVCPDVMMSTGIYLGFTTTADVGVTVTYR
jgi:hypothetical protein